MSDQGFMSNIEAEYIKERCRRANWEEMKLLFPEFWDFVERLPDSHNANEKLRAPYELIETYKDAKRWAKDHLKNEMSKWKKILSRLHRQDETEK